MYMSLDREINLLCIESVADSGVGAPPPSKKK